MSGAVFQSVLNKIFYGTSIPTSSQMALRNQRMAAQSNTSGLSIKDIANWNVEGSGKPVQTIKNRYPGEPQAGKEFGYTVKDGKILIDNSIQDVDFVVDMNNNLHIERGHSFLAGGKDVQAAGTIKVNSQGYVRNITNASGHFAPTVEQAKLFPNVLNNLGIRTENAWLELGDYHFTPSGYVDVTKSKIIVEQIK